MIYDVPSHLPQTPSSIQQAQAYASKHDMSLDEVCGGIVAKALNQANMILDGLGTVTFTGQNHMPPPKGSKLLINPMIDDEKQKGRMINFAVEVGQVTLKIGSLGIMDKGRNGENIEDIDILAQRIALAALSHLAAYKLMDVTDLRGLKLIKQDQDACQIDMDDKGYMTVAGARVLWNRSPEKTPAYTVIKTSQISTGLPQHFIKFGDLNVMMMHDYAINEDELEEEFYFSCDSIDAAEIPLDQFKMDTEKTKDAEDYRGQYVSFFRLKAPSHNTTGPCNVDMQKLRQRRTERIQTKEQWKSICDVNLYPDDGLSGIQVQIKSLKKKF